MSSKAFLYNPTEDTLAAAGSGFQLPIVTTAVRTGMSPGTGARGLMVWDQDLLAIFQWNGTAWSQVATGSGTSPFSFSQSTFGGQTLDVITGAGTNPGIVLAVGGTGYLSVQAPDGTATGGDIRGNNSVDLQSNRSAANLVSSGQYAVIGGGQNNRVSSFAGTIPGGYSNYVTGQGGMAWGGLCGATARGATAGGELSVASGFWSTAYGYQTLVSGTGAFGVGEGGNIASDYASGFGQKPSITSNQGQTAFSDSNGTAGETQHNIFLVKRVTTDAIPAILTPTGSGTAGIVLPLNSLTQLTVKVNAKTDTAGAEYAAWERRVVVWIGATAATAVIVGTPDVIGTDVGSFAGTPPPAWVLELLANTTNGGLNIRFTGQVGKTIRVGASAEGHQTIR